MSLGFLLTDEFLKRKWTLNSNCCSLTALILSSQTSIILNQLLADFKDVCNFVVSWSCSLLCTIVTLRNSPYVRTYEIFSWPVPSCVIISANLWVPLCTYILNYYYNISSMLNEGKGFPPHLPEGSSCSPTSFSKQNH